MKAYFMWTELRPDGREFRMNSTVLQPQEFVVGVEVPDTAEYLVNFAEVNAAILAGQTAPKPIYTPAGVKFCLDYFEKYFVVTPDDFKQKPDEDEWEEETTKEKSTKASDDDTWEEDIDTDDKTSDDKWDEDTENWESE